MADIDSARRGACASYRCDFVALTLGLALVAAPWALGYKDHHTAMFSSVAAGLAIWGCSLMSLRGMARPFEEAGAICGVLAAAAPWFVGFREVHEAVTAHAAIGMAVALVSLGGALWSRSRTQPVQVGNA